MKEAIVLWKSNPTLAAHAADLDRLNEEFKQKMTFIQKQADNAREEYNKASEKVWQDVTTFVESNLTMPSWYDAKTCGMEFEESGSLVVIGMSECKDCGERHHDGEHTGIKGLWNLISNLSPTKPKNKK